MTIDELLAAAGLTANDEIPIWDAEATGEPTKKITAANLASAVVALANLVTGVKGNAESSYRTDNVNLTPANIGAVAITGDTIKNPTTDTITALFVRGTKSSGSVELRCDEEGGNIEIIGPNGGDSWFQFDAVDNTTLRCFAIRNASYKEFKFNGVTGVLSATGGFEGNATTATGIKDAGNSSKTITIRYGGTSANATDLIPMYDSNGNLVPVTIASLKAKLGIT